MSTLQIHLLGSPNVTWEGEALVIPRRQVRALLYRLAITLRPVAREQLCLLFWPELSDKEAHRDFTHLLTHLRRVLPCESMVQDVGESVYLDAKLVWSDVAAFDQMTTHLATQSVTHLEEAIDLYQGLFLDGFTLPSSSEYENWITLQRAWLEQRYLATLEALANHANHQGDYQRAIDYTQRRLVVDPLDEMQHRRMMELYLKTGNRSGVIRQFGTCKKILDVEMGIEPVGETYALYQAALGD